MHLSTFSSIYSKYENAHFREKAAAAHENPFYFIFFPRRHQYFDRYYRGC